MRADPNTAKPSAIPTPDGFAFVPLNLTLPPLPQTASVGLSNRLVASVIAFVPILPFREWWDAQSDRKAYHPAEALTAIYRT